MGCLLRQALIPSHGAPSIPSFAPPVPSIAVCTRRISSRELLRCNNPRFGRGAPGGCSSGCRRPPVARLQQEGRRPWLWSSGATVLTVTARPRIFLARIMVIALTVPGGRVGVHVGSEAERGSARLRDHQRRTRDRRADGGRRPTPTCEWPTCVPTPLRAGCWRCSGR